MSSSSDSRKEQMVSLRKKIFKYKESSAHQAAAQVLFCAKEKTLENAYTRVFENEKEVTANIFRTAYKVAKKSTFQQF